MQTFRPTPLHDFDTPTPSIGGSYGEGHSPFHAQQEVDKKKFRTLVLIMAIISLIVFIIIIAVLGRNKNIQQRTPIEVPGTVVADSGSIVVDTPVNGDSVTPPIVVTGKAKGYWFNRGFFPVSVYDVDRNLVAQTYAIAEGDWTQITEMVPFRATITSYDKLPIKKAGHIVFQKGNIVSGMSDNEFLVAVEFSRKSRKAATSTSGSSSSSSTTTAPTIPACRDGKDNDADGLVDTVDPGCHSDNNANNPSTYSMTDTNEINTTNTTSSNTNTQNSTTYCAWKNVQTGECLD